MNVSVHLQRPADCVILSRTRSTAKEMNNHRRVIMITTALLMGVTLWTELHPHPVLAQSPGLAGSYGFSITVPYTGNDNGPAVIQGVVTLDGAGNVTSIGGASVGRDPDPNASGPQVQPLDSNPGTYTVNPDGTGTMTFTNPSGKTTAISLVVTDGGSQMMLAVTSGFGNTVATGTARKQ
jgi:hypothetical protein